jgi:hypothetical protein
MEARGRSEGGVHTWKAGELEYVVNHMQLSVNGRKYGPLKTGDNVLIESGRVKVNDVEQVVVPDQFLDVEPQLADVRGHVRQLHPERHERVGPRDRVLGVDLAVEVSRVRTGQDGEAGRHTGQPALPARRQGAVPVKAVRRVGPEPGHDVRHADTP